MSTSAQLPLCVYCGTERPADRSQCPQCGRPWIDVRVGSLAESKAQVLVGAAATTETPNVSASPIAEDPSGPDVTVDLDAVDTDSEQDPDTPSFRWAIPLVLGFSAVTVVTMFALGLLEGDQSKADGQTVAATPATAPTTAAAPTSTTPPTTAPPLTSTIPTTTEPPVPTTSVPEPAELAAVGDSVPVSRLRLHSGGVGPIEIGTPAPVAIGVLVASLGTPEEVAIAGVEHGLCADEEGRLVRWAELTAVVSGTIADGTFVGYRYQEPAVPTRQLDLATPSGIRLGDAIATLNEVYASYAITYESIGEASTFSLFDGDELLLWGPVSSAVDTGRVEGIFSPPSCESA